MFIFVAFMVALVFGGNMGQVHLQTPIDGAFIGTIIYAVLMTVIGLVYRFALHKSLGRKEIAVLNLVMIVGWTCGVISVIHDPSMLNHFARSLWTMPFIGMGILAMTSWPTAPLPKPSVEAPPPTPVIPTEETPELNKPTEEVPTPKKERGPPLDDPTVKSFFDEGEKLRGTNAEPTLIPPVQTPPTNVPSPVPSLGATEVIMPTRVQIAPTPKPYLVRNPPDPSDADFDIPTGEEDKNKVG